MREGDAQKAFGGSDGDVRHEESGRGGGGTAGGGGGGGRRREGGRGGGVDEGGEGGAGERRQVWREEARMPAPVAQGGCEDVPLVYRR